MTRLNRLSLAAAHAAEIRDIVGSIYALTVILENDACRDASDDEQAVLGPFEQGGINGAIKHLATAAEGYAEAIEDLHRSGDGGES